MTPSPLAKDKQNRHREKKINTFDGTKRSNSYKTKLARCFEMTPSYNKSLKMSCSFHSPHKNDFSSNVGCMCGGGGGVINNVKMLCLTFEIQGCQVPKNKKAKFGHKQFQKRPNSQMVKKAK
jgi:hypothetical protein